ncbi:MAG: hypothetical protein K0S04_1155 [Herbinix sp.]|jgi:cell division septal protein FtsQ|nr:hypothetical protein [Herbinix sp.]
MKKIRYKYVILFCLIGILWLVYAFLFPLYRISDSNADKIYTSGSIIYVDEKIVAAIADNEEKEDLKGLFERIRMVAKVYLR